MLRIVSIGIASLAVLSSHAFAQSPCDSALIRATYNRVNSSDFNWQMAEKVDQSTFNQIKQSASGSATIYGVPAEGNWEDFRTKMESYKRETSSGLSHSMFQNIAWTGLDPGSDSVYRTCVDGELRKTGLRAFVTRATQSDISISVRYTAPGPRSVSLEWAGKSSLPAPVQATLPDSIRNGATLAIVVPRPQKQITIAGNADKAFASDPIVLEPLVHKMDGGLPPNAKPVSLFSLRTETGSQPDLVYPPSTKVKIGAQEFNGGMLFRPRGNVMTGYSEAKVVTWRLDGKYQFVRAMFGISGFPPCDPTVPPNRVALSVFVDNKPRLDMQDVKIGDVISINEYVGGAATFRVEVRYFKSENCADGLLAQAIVYP